jgi:hypothetical protein
MHELLTSKLPSSDRQLPVGPYPDTVKVQLIVIHMRVFDWPILMENVARYGLEMPKIQGVFCSQKTAISWARQ